MAEVFISYRHVVPDQDLATKLSESLESHGVSCFRDTEILMGENWVQTIERELRNCESFVVLLSVDSIRSDMVRQEVKLAHQWGKRILPVRVNYDGALPYDLGSYLDLIQYKLWRTDEPLKPIFDAILDGVHGKWTKGGLEPSKEAIRRLGQLTEFNGAPLPAADPRFEIDFPETGGLKLSSRFYVRRAEDERVEQLVRQTGETILIKGPRQVGKTSLSARACSVAEGNKQQVCYIDLQLLDQSRLGELGPLCRYMAARVARDLQTAIKPSELWDDALGDTDCLTDFIQQAVLPGKSLPIVLCLDEVDNIFRYPYRDNFFGMLRGWHNRRATHKVWNQFNLLIAHSTEPALFIADLNQSPFNVGAVIRLGDFGRDEVLWLNARHGSPLCSDEDLSRLMRLIGGHPYLVRQALHAASRGRMSVADLEGVAVSDNGPFGDHLRRHLWLLRENQRLRKSLNDLIKGRGCEDEDDFQRLRGVGLIEGESRNLARMRCELYERYMRKHL
jgi:hypothetical protein